MAQWFEVRWWKDYLSEKDPVQYLGWKKSYWKSFLSQLDVSVSSESWVLDAGCGPAGIYMILDKCKVDAFDPLLERYERELAVFAKKRHPHVRFSTFRLEDWTSDRLYDYAFCINAINHVKEIDRSFQNLVQAVKPGGTVVVSIDCHKYPLLKQVFRILPLDILHPHQYDLRDYRYQLERTGVSIERTVLLKSGNLFDYYALVGTKN